MSVFPVQYVYAQEEQSAQTEAEKMDEKDIEKAKQKMLNDKIMNISAGLDQKEFAHFMVIYSSYAVVNMVMDVQTDVGTAVKACIENNPDMEDKVQARYDEWNKVVGKSLADAESNINNMGLAQDYIPQSELKELNAMVRATRNEAALRFEKTPVSTPEACEFMLTKMDDTQNTMVGLLGATIENFSKVLQKTQP
ncbi:MAG: hypothetical protein OEY94_06020 [Alphaproteobacteria bacterium]|nr:hypothetical protein [Alphaproteobacteria bacterium]